LEEAFFVDKKMPPLGTGTYGIVQRGVEKETGKRVAIKSFFKDSKKKDVGGPMDTMTRREIDTLSKLHSSSTALEGIVRVLEVCALNAEGGVSIVMECAQHDLYGLLRWKGSWARASGEIQCWFRQIIRGLDHCHKNNIMHRDLKPENILVNPDGRLVLADFGMAHEMLPNYGRYTYRVTTQWYRAPELLLRMRDYTSAIDVWSAGCILAEMILGNIVFAGPVGKTDEDSDAGQMQVIWSICGTPNKEDFPTYMHETIRRSFTPGRPIMPRQVKQMENLDKYHRRSLKTPDALSCLESILQIAYKKRPTASQLLTSPYLTSSNIYRVEDCLTHLKSHFGK
jgi:serine/threonine protein kinase